MNGKHQRKLRDAKRLKKAEAALESALVEYNVINQILSRNKLVEETLRKTVGGGCLSDVTVDSFMGLNIPQLKDFIHCRKFSGKTFHETQLLGSSKSLKKTLRREQTAAEVADECDVDNPCYVWLAWKLRSEELVLQCREEPVLQVINPQPSFSYDDPSIQIAPKKASDYLRDQSFVDAFAAEVEGVNVCSVDDEMLENADKLVPLLEQRLNIHISDRVDDKLTDHITLKFVRQNLPAVAAQMCLAGHVVGDVGTSSCDDRLLALTHSKTFSKLDDDDELNKLEGSYLYYDPAKDKWISGYASGLSTNFQTRMKQHKTNSLSLDQMRGSKFYSYYHSKDSKQNLGVRNAYFENLDSYCAMAFNPKNVSQMCSTNDVGSLFEWDEKFVQFLQKKAESKTTSLKRMQLSAVGYLWEMCYDLMLARSDNISESPGFEGLGLRGKKH
jgi:hypothetical protein